MTGAEVKSILEQHSPLSLFPELLEGVLRNAQLITARPGTILRPANGKADEILIPLDGGFRALIPTGRPGEQRLLYKYTLGSLAELAALGTDVASSTIVTDQATHVVKIKKSKFKELLSKDPSIVPILHLLNVSSPIVAFALTCLKKGLSHRETVKILAKVSPKHQILNRQTPMLNLTDIIFVQSGSANVRVFKEGQAVANVIAYAGLHVGAGLIQRSASFQIQLFPTSEMQIYTLKIADIVTVLGQERAELIGDEEWLQDTLPPVPKSAAPRNLVVRKLALKELHASFPDVDIEKICKSTDLGQAPLCTLVNTAALLHTKFSEIHATTEIEVSRCLSLGRFAEILERQGFLTRCFRSSFADLQRQRFPLIVFFGLRPCVLVSVRGQKVLVLDPTKGLLEIDVESFTPRWNHQALEVQVSPVEYALELAATKKKLDNAAYIADHAAQDMLRDDKGYRNIFYLGLCVILLEALLPKFFEYTLDVILVEKNFHAVHALAVAFFIVIVAIAIAASVRSYFISIKSTSLNFSVGSTFIRQLIQIPSPTVGASKAGEYNSRIFLVEGIVEYWNKLAAGRNMILAMVGINLTILFFYSWIVGGVSVLFAAAAVGYRRFSMAMRLQQMSGISVIRKSAYDGFIDQLSSVSHIRSRNAQGHIGEKLETPIMDVSRIYQLSINYINRGDGVASIISGLALGCCIAVFIAIAREDQISAGKFVAAVAYLSMFWVAVQKLGQMAESDSFLKFETSGLMPLLRTDLDYSKLNSTKATPVSLVGKIRFEKVGFKYNASNSFGLYDISFTISPGQTIAIVGQNGSGKTTLGKLIAGLFTAKSGTVYFDDTDAKLISKFSLLDQIAYVPSKPIIFSGTIAANIAYGDDSPDMDRVKEAAMGASIHQFITSLPSGYDFFVNSKDTALSVGQQMLITIARALYRDPRILVIDDAGAHIDARSHRALSENLRAAMRGRTIIFISHRLSTVRYVDQVIVVKRGSLVGFADHSELMAKNPEYVQLFKSQVSAY